MTEQMGHEDEKSKITFQHTWALIRTTTLWALFIVLGLELYGAALTIPIFAYFCIHELGLNAQSVGALLSAFNLAQAIGGPTFGRVSDAFGRKNILLLCFFWSSCCFCATSFVRGFWDLFFIRSIAGLSGGSIPVAAAVIMDCANPAERPGVLGVKGAVLGVAFTCGPFTVIALLAMEMITRRQVFFMAGCFCFAGFFLGLMILRESLVPEKRRPLCGAASAEGDETEPKEHVLITEMRDDWSGVRACLWFAWISRFFYGLSVFSLYATFAFLIKDLYGWGDKEFGILLSIAGVCQGILEMFFYPKVDAKTGEHGACIIGFFMVGVGMLILPSPTLWVFFTAFVVFQVGQSLAEPGVVNLVGLLAPSEKHMGFAQGMGNAFRAIASVIGPFTAGTLYDINPAYPYYFAFVAAMCATVAVAISMMLPRPDRLPEEEEPLAGKKL